MNQENPRPADEYRKVISDALEGINYFVDRIDLFCNGDWQALYVNASSKGLTLFKQDLNNSDIEYIMIDNKFTNVKTSMSTEDIIYDLIRFLDYKQLEKILNKNLDIFNNRHLQIIDEDVDRGYISCVIYRNGSKDMFHLIEPDTGGTIIINKSIFGIIIDITNYNPNDLLEEHPNLVVI